MVLGEPCKRVVFPLALSSRMFRSRASHLFSLSTMQMKVKNSSYVAIKVYDGLRESLNWGENSKINHI